VEAFQLAPDKTPSAAYERDVGAVTTGRQWRQRTSALYETVLGHVYTQRQQHVEEQRQLKQHISTTTTASATSHECVENEIKVLVSFYFTAFYRQDCLHDKLPYLISLGQFLFFFPTGVTRRSNRGEIWHLFFSVSRSHNSSLCTVS